MKPEKQQLIHDLLGEVNPREATLAAGARILRRRRHVRYATQGFALVVIVAATAWLALPHSPQRAAPTVISATKPAEPQTPKALTDEELLALFPGTPVGLATLADGTKRLVFPRPGDEARFVTRL
jgi:hypothetical protein